MIEVSLFELLLWAVGGFVSTIVAVAGILWGQLRGIRKEQEDARQRWDTYVAKTDRAIMDLLEDHKDIKRSLGDINDELTNKVEKIVTDHAEHDKAMAAVLEIVRIIQRTLGTK